MTAPEIILLGVLIALFAFWAGRHVGRGDDQAGTAANDLLATLTPAAADVLTERRRQVDVEGWTPEHDDEHNPGDLAAASASYALAAASVQRRTLMGDDWRTEVEMPPMWPWAREWWKPGSARRMLEKAGALNQAAMEQIDRAVGRPGA